MLRWQKNFKLYSFFFGMIFFSSLGLSQVKEEDSTPSFVENFYITAGFEKGLTQWHDREETRESDSLVIELGLEQRVFGYPVDIMLGGELKAGLSIIEEKDVGFAEVDLASLFVDLSFLMEKGEIYLNLAELSYLYKDSPLISQKGLGVHLLKIVFDKTFASKTRLCGEVSVYGWVTTEKGLKQNIEFRRASQITQSLDGQVCLSQRLKNWEIEAQVGYSQFEGEVIDLEGNGELREVNVYQYSGELGVNYRFYGPLSVGSHMKGLRQKGESTTGDSVSLLINLKGKFL